MNNFKYILLSVIFEVGAISLLFSKNNSLDALFGYFATHAISTAALLVLMSKALHARPPLEQKLILFYAFTLNLLVPAFGLICAIFSSFYKLILPLRKVKDKFDATEDPKFTTFSNHEGSGFRGGHIRAQLSNSLTPLDQRMKALVAMQDAPARITGKFLKSLLSDSADDLRLLAYAILDSKEQRITQRISNFEDKLKKTIDVTEIRDMHKWLAELYWELIFQNLVQGDMQIFCANQTRLHINAAIQIHEDAGLWFILGRLELLAGRKQEAEHALLQAKAFKFSPDRLLPYLAELYFLQNRFSEVRYLFSELGGRSSIPALTSSRNFWISGTKQFSSVTK